MNMLDQYQDNHTRFLLEAAGACHPAPSNLRILMHTSTLVSRFGNGTDTKNFSWDSIPDDDSLTYGSLKNSRSLQGLPMFSNSLIRLLQQMQPCCYENLIALHVLHTPEAVTSGLTGKYIERKNNQISWEYIIPELQPILQSSYGLILYRQQALCIAQEIAGLSEYESNRLLEAIRTTNNSYMDVFRTAFLDGCLNRGIPKPSAEDIFNQLMMYTDCYRSREHAETTAFYRYRMAWFHTHFPLYLRAGILTEAFNNIGAIQAEIWNCKENNIAILPPDINRSHALCVPEGKAIRIGLAAISAISQTTLNHLLEVRTSRQAELTAQGASVRHAFSTFEGFINAVNLDAINAEEIARLIKAGTFRTMLDNPGGTIQFLKDIFNDIKKFGSISKTTRIRVAASKWNNAEILDAEHEALGCYISMHPLTEHIPPFFKESLASLAPDGNTWKMHTVFARVISVETYKYYDQSDQKEIAIVELDDPYAHTSVLVDSDSFSKLEAVLKPNSLLLTQLVFTAPGISSDNAEPGLKLVDAFNIKRKLPEIASEHFHFDYVKFMAEKQLANNIIETTTALIQENSEQPVQIRFDSTRIPTFDAKTYHFLHGGNTERLFLFDNPNCSKLLKNLNPKNFEELLIAVALSFPGHLSNGTAEKYIEYAQGLKEPRFILPEVKSMLGPTFGLIIFQEQLREIVEKLAGFTPDESRCFYRALARKNPAEMLEMRSSLKKGIGKTMTGDEANALFEWLEENAGYIIKKENLIEPVATSYHMAWLKVHHFNEFERTIKRI